MLIKKYILMASVSMTIFGALSSAQAEDSGLSYKKMGYVPAYMGLLTPAQKSSLQFYTANEVREPCQNYRDPPIGFYRDGCTIMYRNKEQSYPRSSPPIREKSLATYQINFDFDSIKLDRMADTILDQVAKDILIYQPRLVTVSGFTDSVGTKKYNASLSERRAEMISHLLQSHGIENQIIDENFYGEDYQAVETQDNIKLRENRRVQIDFLK